MRKQKQTVPCDYCNDLPCRCDDNERKVDAIRHGDSDS